MLGQINLPHISIVAIGYNEAKNLDKTFQAIENMNYPQELIEKIYVDSGSSDDSVEIARRYTDKVFIEPRFPSPGRNRNRGLLEAKFDIVHFIDGDVVIDPDYLKNIVPLFEEKNVQAIVGQLDEQYPNIYNRMAALSNVEKKEGYASFTSTGASYKREALLAVNGYDERIRRGQEAELGERFRKAGFKIWCTHHKMGSHNFAVNNLWQYLKKYEINGRSMLQLALIQGESDFVKSARPKIKKQIFKIPLFLLAIFLSLLFSNLYFIVIYLLITWALRNRGFLIKKIKRGPTLVILRSLIDFFFIWKWWVGFFRELWSRLTSAKAKEFYSLPKMILVKN